jgi:hypothetical protein
MELKCWMMDCWVLPAILLAFVRDFGWTCWWTYVGCFGPVEKISIMPIQQSSITLFWVCSSQC